jgi:mannose-6-phosphate isomerase-like protein (cupin superfamily)
MPQEPNLDEQNQATTSSGTSSTLLGRGTFAGPFNIHRKDGNDGAVFVEVRAKNDLDVAAQTITFAPGAHSGWHSHPGPVFITVVSGTMTFYDSDDPDCHPIVRTAGQGFLDGGSDNAHIARNETKEPATNLVVYMAPVGGALRIDRPAPGNCPF